MEIYFYVKKNHEFPHRALIKLDRLTLSNNSYSIFNSLKLYVFELRYQRVKINWIVLLKSNMKINIKMNGQNEIRKTGNATSSI